MKGINLIGNLEMFHVIRKNEGIEYKNFTSCIIQTVQPCHLCKCRACFSRMFIALKMQMIFQWCTYFRAI